MQLRRAIYLQAAFLALAYLIGVYQTVTSQPASFTMPVVIEHGIGAAGFALMTGLVGLIAGIQGLRRISLLNLALFFVTVVGGATGFSFLGNPTDISQMNTTNLAMIGVVGVSMPVTGYSIAAVSRRIRGVEAADDKLMDRLTYFTLMAIAGTVITGTAVVSLPLNGAMLNAHFAFTGVTILFLMGVLLAAARKGLADKQGTANPRRLDYTLVAVGGVAVAVANGALEYLGGGVSYILAMAEFAAVAYGFLVLLAAAPPAVSVPTGLDLRVSTDHGRRLFLQLAVTASIALAAVGVAGLFRSITLAPPPSNVPPPTFPSVKVANVSDLTVGQPVDFNYPLDDTPNILVKLGTAVSGGVGPDGDIVAFSQLCQHLGCVVAYVAPGAAPVCNSGYKAPGPEAYCCCHGSIYDLANAGKVLGGPAPRPIPQVILTVDSSGDIYATGMTPPAIFGHNTGSNDVSNDLQGGTIVS